MSGSLLRVRALVLAVSGVLSLSACLELGGDPVMPPPQPAVATVDGVDITERDLVPLLANGLDRVNAIDRAINRTLAAQLGRQTYGDEVAAVVRVADTEISANIFAVNRMAEFMKAVTDEDLEQRYAVTVKEADFNGYQLYFAFFGSEADAKAGRAAAQAGKADALKAFAPVAADRDGKALFVARNEVPYNLGVFVAKLKEGDFTEPALVRNGYIVLQARHIKSNPKPELAQVKDMLRRAIADERLAKFLADNRAKATIVIQ